MQSDGARPVLPARPIEAFCCQNVRCSLHGQKGQGNLRQKGWSDRRKTIRTLICNACGKRFSERKGTVFYQVRLSTEKALSVLQHLQDHSKCAIRFTAEDKFIVYSSILVDNHRE